ncbi:PREDICTED: F-box protein At5g49610-like [Nelumbo nucifera]|uniref:F-box protein At5g49610-like n=1 Tax=Nelumbo nucifera TaxID=4432 RepID=A0A1U8PZF3_NELNU|nr:PREDICTED: F-box protein At5g49610-like [Nelumbo nucifera]XP_019051908.1 PREDICTED: F-box protein At5g49610-like [Nelumbo nucifera]XP_019051909.1 PREDICTED: F-box protein At5g49610-like [Nelumbo nucifera]
MEIGLSSDDIPIEVLSRLPAKTLLGLKCVSRGWHHLISDPAFIRVQIQRSKEAISGFFFQEKFHWCDADIETLSYIPIGREQAVVKHTVLDFLPEKVVIMDSSNGLICCRSCMPAPDPVIYVCNPSNKEWVTLKWAKPEKSKSLALLFDPFCNPIDTPMNFKVISVHQIETDTDLYFSFKIYCSEKGAWRESKENCFCHYDLFKRKGVFAGGVLHWLTNGDQILTFNVENEQCQLINLPTSTIECNDLPEMCIGEAEGHLHYIMISTSGLQVWILEDYSGPKWVLKDSISLAMMEEENPQFLYNLLQRTAGRVTFDMIPWIEPLAFKDGLLLMRVSSRMYLYHLESRRMKELCSLTKLGPNSLVYPTVLPYSMSLIRLAYP